eukprot:4701874-Pleurochrysis_carterae.AAC.6
MLCKWGHPVTTLPLTNGTICHTSRITETLRIRNLGSKLARGGDLPADPARQGTHSSYPEIRP